MSDLELIVDHAGRVSQPNSRASSVNSAVNGPPTPIHIFMSGLNAENRDDGPIEGGDYLVGPVVSFSNDTTESSGDSKQEPESSKFASQRWETHRPSTHRGSVSTVSSSAHPASVTSLIQAVFNVSTTDTAVLNARLSSRAQAAAALRHCYNARRDCALLARKFRQLNVGEPGALLLARMEVNRASASPPGTLLCVENELKTRKMKPSVVEEVKKEQKHRQRIKCMGAVSAFLAIETAVSMLHCEGCSTVLPTSAFLLSFLTLGDLTKFVVSSVNPKPFAPPVFVAYLTAHHSSLPSSAVALLLCLCLLHCAPGRHRPSPSHL